MRVRQGEAGDRAYLLAEGKAQVIIEHGGAAGQLAVLEPGALFGEAALLTGLQRNATVRTILDCDLLVLRRDDFLEVVAADRGAGMKIMQLLRLRDMPLRESAVEVFDTTTPEGDPIRILKNPVRRTFSDFRNVAGSSGRARRQPQSSRSDARLPDGVKVVRAARDRRDRGRTRPGRHDQDGDPVPDGGG